MSVILNEKEWVEDIIAEKRLGKTPYNTLVLVAKYMHYIDGFGKVEIRKRIERFLLQCDPCAKTGSWDKKFDSIIRRAIKTPLTIIDEICITEKELATIEALPNRQPKRIAFTLLCLAKYWNIVKPSSNWWITTPDKDIMKMANVSTSIDRQCRMLYEIKEAGMIGFPKKLDSLSIQVLFADSDSPVVLRITDFRNLGNQYNMYYGEKYIQCSHCGLTVKKRANAHKLCSGCVSEMYIKKSVGAVMRRKAG